MPVTTKARKRRTGEAGEGELFRGNRRNLVVEHVAANSRPPGRIERAAKKSRGRGEILKSRRRVKRGTDLSQSIGGVIIAETAMCRNPKKGNHNIAVRERESRGEDRMDGRRKKEKRARGKFEKGRQRVRKDGHRRKRTDRKMVNTPGEPNLQGAKLSYKARAMSPGRLGERHRQRTNSTGNEDPGSTRT